MLSKSIQNKLIEKSRDGNSVPAFCIAEEKQFLLFITSADFIEFISQKLQLGSNCTAADAESVGGGFPFIFAKLSSHKAAFTVCRQHFVNFIDDRDFFHFVTP